jgi:hypothetical protein
MRPPKTTQKRQVLDPSWQIIQAARLACETDEACVAEILLEGAAIRPRPWIESPSQRDPGIARIL